MLCQFSFKNFYSYKERTVFDFQAATIPEMEDSLIKCNKASPILPVGVVYGPNGGGKTNLLKALACMITTVVNPIVDMKKGRKSIVVQNSVDPVPFAFDKASSEESTDFQVFFRTNGNEYQYNISILNDEIEEESLYWRAIGGKKTGIVFERKRSEIILGASIKKDNLNIQVNPKMPYLSFLAINYDIPTISEVITWFESCIIQNYGNSSNDKKIYLINEDKAKKILLRALNDLDIDISDYQFNEEEKRLYTIHTVNGKDFSLPFEYESDGTRKLIAALPVILLALYEGRLVIFDELDAKLHPKLLRYIIKLFRNTGTNPRGAQLLFTSHDLTTMKNDVFRRDEIWFACVNDKHESGIYSLYDIRDEKGRHINNTFAYDKQYLEGRYGADPYLQNILGGEWNEPETD